MMEWSYFYGKYSTPSDSKIKSYISLLEDIDSANEFVYVIVDVDNEEIKRLLINKAIQLGVEFDLDDFETLDCEIPSTLWISLWQMVIRPRSSARLSASWQRRCIRKMP